MGLNSSSTQNTYHVQEGVEAEASIKAADEPSDGTHVGRIARADKRGRVTLGPQVSDKEFTVTVTPRGEYVLTPVVTMPEHEAWLFQSSEALASVRRGLADAAAGRTTPAPSFAGIRRRRDRRLMPR